MRPSLNINILLLSLISLVLLASTSSSAGASHVIRRPWLINGVCGLASAFDGRFDKQYCVSSIKAAPFDENLKDCLHGLGWVSLNMLIKNVTTTKAKIEHMVKAGDYSPEAKEVLKNCISMYDEAVDETTLALELYDNKNYDLADVKTSLMGSDGYECEDAFSSEGLPSPLTKENLDAQYLSAITVQIIRMFNKSYDPWGTRINVT